MDLIHRDREEILGATGDVHEKQYLPELCTDLVAALASLHVHDLTHRESSSDILWMKPARCLVFSLWPAYA
jgi:hypothetical protein